MTLNKARQRNPRGAGYLLRGELIRAATSLLEETGNESDVTIRAVAKRANVAPTSVYTHFDGVGAILSAVIAEAFDALTQDLQGAANASHTAVDKFLNVCDAYITYAHEYPGSYRAMFNRFGVTRSVETSSRRELEELGGAPALRLLISACKALAMDNGTPGRDPVADAIAVWVTLHGYVSLHDALPAFPWPSELLPSLLNRLVGAPTHPTAARADLTPAPAEQPTANRRDENE